MLSVSTAITPLDTGRRRSLAAKSSIDVGAGVVDPDYRGEVKVVLSNSSDKPFLINRDDRIAQVICESYRSAEVREVETLEQLGFTARAGGGFGSTGRSKHKEFGKRIEQQFLGADEQLQIEAMQAPVVLERPKGQKKKKVKKSI